MRRRDFIAGLGSAAAIPAAGRAQLRDAFKRIAWVGVTGEVRKSFERELAKLGWVEGRNLRIEALDETEDRIVRAVAPFIVGTAPDLIAVVGTEYTEIFKRLTDTIPILFLNVADPVASGFVVSFAHPGGNVTGFTNLQFSLAGKWLTILKNLVPSVANVMMLYEPANANWRGYLPVLQEAAHAFDVTVHPAPAAAIADAERQIETFSRDAGGGMIVIPGGLERIPVDFTHSLRA